MAMQYVELFIGNSHITKDYEVLFIGNDYHEDKPEHKDHIITFNLGIKKEPHCEILVDLEEDFDLDVKLEELLCIKAIRDEVRLDVGDIDLHDLVQVVSCPGLNQSDLLRKFIDIV